MRHHFSDYRFERVCSSARTVKSDYFQANSQRIPQAGEGAYRICALVQPEVPPHPYKIPAPDKDPPYRPIDGDRQRSRWASEPGEEVRMAEWRDGEEVSRGALIHDESGKAVLTDRLASGVYRLYYTTKDSYGSEFTLKQHLKVLLSDTKLQLPIYVLSSVESCCVGESVEILLGSGFRNSVVFWEIAQGQRLIRRSFTSNARKCRALSIPVEASFRGGFTVSVHMVNDYHMFSATKRIFVPWDNKALNLEFVTFRDRLEPGQDETWEIRVSGPDAEPAAAELLAYMYDRSLDFFAPDSNPLVLGLYPEYRHGRGIGVWRYAGEFRNILRLNRHENVSEDKYIPDSLNQVSGYGAGGPGMRRFAAMNAPLGMGEAVDEAPMMEMSKSGSFDTTDGAPVAPEHPQESGRMDDPPDAGVNGSMDIELRSDFAETAFFMPHITCDTRGLARIQFRVPESVTAWNIYVHALTADLKSAVLTETVETRKELMVRPYIPRFLREGDRAKLEIAVNNAGAERRDGIVSVKIIQTDSELDCTRMFALNPVQKSFSVEPGSGTAVSFEMTAPAGMEVYGIEVSAASGVLRDGERRPLVVLPGRMHLVQSRFVTLGDDTPSRDLSISDPARAFEDTSLIHEGLNIQAHGQLFYHVLSALPYLVYYPHDCVEQVLNRFLSTAIVSSLYDRYPEVAEAAKEFSSRATRLETWDFDDPNRKIALEETPWLTEARGGESGRVLINVLNPEIAGVHERAALRKLADIQNTSGGFPWWPGGPDSPFMTLYLLQGFARAAEYGVTVPRRMIRKTCRFLGDHYRGYYEKNITVEDRCPEFIVFLNYVLSCFSDTAFYSSGFSSRERQAMLNAGYRNWKSLPPQCKAMLALTLERAGRHDDAVLVMDAVMDSARTEPDQGTFWAPEDRGWLWYNDHIESHAMILRALMELNESDSRTDGLALWLMLNKKMNHWKSTRATAEVIYALVHYLQGRDALSVRQEIHINAGSKTAVCVFDPGVFEPGSCCLRIPGSDIDPETMSQIRVTKSGNGFAFASMDWRYSTEKLPEHAQGDYLNVHRTYYLRMDSGDGAILKPLSADSQPAVGDQLEVHLSITAKHPMEYVHLRDPRGAGFEPEQSRSGYQWNTGLSCYREIRDSGTNFFFEWLPQGEYTFKYRIRAAMCGEFKVGPAVIQSMYAPEFSAFSKGHKLKVNSIGDD